MYNRYLLLPKALGIKSVTNSTKSQTSFFTAKPYNSKHGQSFSALLQQLYITGKDTAKTNLSQLQHYARSRAEQRFENSTLSNTP